VVVTQVGDRHLVLHLRHLMYYHLIQGEIDGQAWLVAFCLICNAGMCFVPRIEGQALDLQEAGLYEAMTILRDSETRSLWHLTTGLCLHGARQGARLPIRHSLHQSTAAQALSTYPDALYVVSPEPDALQQFMQETAAYDITQTPTFSPRMNAMLVNEDARLPRLEAGLGVWTATQQRFYPLARLYQAGNVVLDHLNDLPLVVYIEPETHVPRAIYHSTQQAEWYGDELHFDQGAVLVKGRLKNSTASLEYPPQLFQRWYSFALVYPQCEIYDF
jgi:hypothetical protein